MERINDNLYRIIIQIILTPYTWLNLAAHICAPNGCPRSRDWDNDILWIQDLKGVNRWWCVEVTRWFEQNWRAKSWALLFRKFEPYYFSDGTLPLRKRIAKDYLMTLMLHHKTCQSWKNPDWTFDISDEYRCFNCYFEIKDDVCRVWYVYVYGDEDDGIQYTTYFSVQTGQRVPASGMVDCPLYKDVEHEMLYNDWHDTYKPKGSGRLISPEQCPFDYQPQLPMLLMPQFARDEDFKYVMVKFRWGNSGMDQSE